MDAEVPKPWTAREWAMLGDAIGQEAARLESQAAQFREGQAIAMRNAEKLSAAEGPSA